jgi:hypothetical protein
MRKPKEIVQALLGGIHEPDVVKELCTPDVTYVSLNYSSPDLHNVMPWCGTGQEEVEVSKRSHGDEVEI